MIKLIAFVALVLLACVAGCSSMSVYGKVSSPDGTDRIKVDGAGGDYRINCNERLVLIPETGPNRDVTIDLARHPVRVDSVTVVFMAGQIKVADTTYSLDEGETLRLTADGKSRR